MTKTIYPPQHIQLPWVEKSTATTATTNAYATLVSFVTKDKDKHTFVLRETAGEDVMYEIQGTLDGTNWVTIVTDQDISANGTAYETLTDLWDNVRIRIIDKVGGTHGSVAFDALARKMR